MTRLTRTSPNLISVLDSPFYPHSHQYPKAMEENTLHFKITVDGNGLKQIQDEAQAAFNGIKKGVADLSSKSVSELQDISLEVMEVVDRFNQLAKSVGISPAELRQTLNYLREMRAEQEKLETAATRRIERLRNAEAKLIREQLANLDAERRAKEKSEKAELSAEQRLASIKGQNIRTVGKLRDDEYGKFISQINNQNKKIKEQGDAAVAAFEKALGVKKKFSDGFSGGAKNVFTRENNGTFSNILGGFGGGGRFGGSIASALDGAFAGGAEGAGAASVVGGLAAGAGIGVAIAAISTFISLIKSATSLLVDWGKAGIQSAADFEMTVNSIAVFSGGVASAKKELSALVETVENTPGLSLESAEKGYRQLRALGFEAENSRKLIEGLGKIQITSGATEQSVERVIVNLTQLSASTARAGQDLKEIIHALPAMRQVFRETFGTSESSKLKALIERDGDAFFTKLADGMEKFKGASGGMNTELVALQNEWTLLLREFGKPVVPVLTEELKDLGGWLRTNKGEFKALGETAATVAGILPSLASGLAIVARGIAAMTTAGLSEIVLMLHRLSQNPLVKKIGGGIASSVSTSVEDAKASIEQAQAAREDLAEKAEIAEEKRHERELKSLQDNFQLRNQTVENAFKIEEERVSSLTTFTVEQEIAKAEMLSQVRRQSLAAQRDSQVSQFNAEIRLAEGNTDKIIDLSIKKAAAINKFNTEIAVNEIKLAKEVADAEQKQLELRRAAAIDFKSIQLDTVKLGFEQVTAETTRGLSKQYIDTTAGYEKLKSATERFYSKERQITAERFNIQLEDKKLTDEQRFNLQEKANLEIIRLREAEKNALLKIEDDQLAAEEAKREKNLQRLKAYYASLGEMIQAAAASFFNPATFSSASVGGFDEIFLEGSKRRGFQGKVNEALSTLNDRRKQAELSAQGKETGMAPENIKTSIVIWSDALKKAEEDLKSFEDSINPVYREISKLGESLTESTENFKDFDRILAVSLKERHRLETESLSAEIGNVQQRLDAERKRYLNEVRSDIDKWNKENDRLTKEGLDVGVNALLKQANDLLISGNQTTLDEAKNSDWLPPTDKAIELSGILKQLGIDFSNLKLKQHAEESELLAGEIEGLTERFNQLNSGDIGAVGGVLNAVAKDIIRERNALLEENIALEARIGVVGDDSAARYRNAWLKAIYDVKNASIEARESQIKSQVEIANQTVFNADVAKAGILEAMAGAKGYTEIFQDAFLSVNQKITDGLSSLIHKATDGLGAFGEILGNIASQLLSMIANRLMMRLLDLLLPTSGSSGSGGIGGSGGGGILPNGWRSLGGVPISPEIFGGFGRPFDSVSSITNAETLTSLTSGGGGLTPDPLTNYGQFARQGASGGLGGLFSNFSLANLGKVAGQAAPLLGLSLGAGLGGQSVGGQLLGSLGGLAGGLALGIGTGAIGTGATAGFSILGGVLSAGAATGILAAAAVPLLLGAWVLGRNKQRRADEKLRTTYITDAFTQLDDILAKVKRHDISGADAIASAEAVRENYRQQATALKSVKTRNIALKEIGLRINPKIEQIRAAAAIADKDKERFEDRVPEFATGGIVPGRFGEPRLVLAHGGEIIANPRQQTPAFLAAATDAGIPGVRGNSGSSGGGGGSLPDINVEFFIGTDAQNQLFINGAKSTKGYNVSIEQSKKSNRFREN